ncbi:MAG: SseB family protein [Georgenia sp.]
MSGRHDGHDHHGGHGHPAPGSAALPGTGKTLRPNPFAGDDGSVQPALAAALAVADDGERLRAVVAALRDGRVIVPVVAHEHPGRDEDGNVLEHDADKFTTGNPQADAAAAAASVAVQTADGRAAMPVFSSMQAMLTWRSDARPVPLEGVRAALTAIDENDSLLVLDPGNAPTVVVPRPAVWALAQGQEWTPSWADEELPGVVTSALAGILELVGVRLERGGQAELRVVLAMRKGLDADRLRDAITRASQALSDDPVLRERVDSMELTPVAVA